MASWCKQDEESAERGLLDGYQVDRPDGIDPLDDNAYERLKILVWADLQKVGMSLRKIADLFGADKDHVARAIKYIPDHIRVGRRPSDRYLARLKKAIDAKPKTLVEFAESMQSGANTLGLEKSVFHNAGIWRSSTQTILGAPRKSRAKSKAAV